MTLVELSVAMVIAGIVLAAGAAVLNGTLSTVRTVDVKDSANADLRTVTEALTRSLRMAYVPQGEVAALAEADPQSVHFFTLLNRETATTSTSGGYPALRAGGGEGEDDPPPPSTSTTTTTTTTMTGTTGPVPTTTAAAPTTTVPLMTSPGGPQVTEVWYGYNTGTRCFEERSRPYNTSVTPSAKCLLRTSQPPQFRYYANGAMVSFTGSTVVTPTPFPTTGSLSAVQRGQVQSVEVLINAQDGNHPDIDGVQTVVRVTLQNLVLAEERNG